MTATPWEAEGVRKVAEVLVSAVPAGHGALDHHDQARLVAEVAVVVHREGYAELVEGDLFGVAKIVMDDLQVRAVGLHAKDGTAVLVVEVFAFLGLQVVAAVTDGEVDATVRTEGKAVEIVAAKADTDTVAFL